MVSATYVGMEKDFGISREAATLGLTMFMYVTPCCRKQAQGPDVTLICPAADSALAHVSHSWRLAVHASDVWRLYSLSLASI